MTVTQAVEALVSKTIGLGDEDMAREWQWGAYDEEGLRFALLMTHHELRDLAVRLATMRPSRTQVQSILAQYHQAYRDLTGVLASVREEELDREPSPGEWPLREVLKHMLGAEHGFLAVNRFALARHRAGTYDTQTEEDWNAFRTPYAMPPDAVAGTIDDVRDAFANKHIENLRVLADITDGEIDLPAQFWEEEHMPIRFRLHRFEEHLRQHTIQLDKTLVAIARSPTEAHRLVRNIYNALADVESAPEPAEELRAQVARTISDRAGAIAR